ncbi:MAG: ATP-binding cassette domain-containing protein [Peptococcaceae bacterium]|jgi:putative ABC transport system ATP-binding protein|nr:ATP-binding cassette domain-containing protein [Peptococcaceae bacterium]
MLKVDKVTKIFNQGSVNEKIALNKISFHLNKGEFVTIIGSNGAGKSTFLNAIAGNFFVDAGTITIGAKEVTKLPQHKRASFISRVYQDPMLGTAGSMTIEENLVMALKRGERRRLRLAINNKTRDFFRSQLEKLGLGLENRLTTKVSLLSGGQRQALTLLMATIKEPELLLLDEHTAALDPKTADTVLKLTCEVTKNSNLTTMMITHDLDQALNVGDRTIMMHEGTIILDLKGTQRKNTTVNSLLEMFEQASGTHFLNDRALFS